MSNSTGAAGDLLRQLGAKAIELRGSRAHWARMATDPAQRAKPEDALAFLDSFLPDLRNATREVADTRELLAKTLRKNPARIHA